MKVTIFDNYHAGAALMSEAEQDAFYGAIMRYAFEGREPEFDGIAAALWATIKPLVDKSLKGQSDGAKGGDGRGNKRDKTPPENPPAKPSAKTRAENPSGKPLQKRGSENQRKEKKERNGKENSESFFSIPSDSVGADAQGAPPESKRPVCPLCESPVRFDARTAKWSCGLCGEIKEPLYVPWKEAS